MHEILTKIFSVNANEDITLLKYNLKNICSEHDFNEYEIEEIILSAVELGTNLINHASGGVIKVYDIAYGDRKGIKLVSEDFGQGINDIELAVKDGYSTAQSLGYGLGSINRMMDKLDISSESGKTIIETYKIKSAENSDYGDFPVDYSIATRKHPKMKVNGDACLVLKWNNYFLATVIDGLGHGQFAHRASQSAKSFIEKHYELDMSTLFAGISRACRATRGIVLSIVKINRESKEMQYAGIGNIETRIIENDNQKKLITRRGIVGGMTINPRIENLPWDDSKSIFMFSDGISTRWNFNDLKNSGISDPAKMSGYILKKYAKYDDDATVIVIQGKNNGK